ncbi:MAG: histidinol-phosphatase HisJ family protein [Oscillospiraceae bacterium]|nr:histidinol-phosphatase HisJ family protein [Oscillospiraceae bacterium]
MFDYHMHTTVSFDGHDTPQQMVQAALAAGLKEICFTDHIDYEINCQDQPMVFSLDAYSAAYDGLTAPGLKIRRGMEFGLKEYNRDQLKLDASKRQYDFILGSIHHVDEQDIYYPDPWWLDKTVAQAEKRYLEQTLRCVQHHDGFDVLGHLTYLSKVAGHPTHKPISYQEHREIVDEILRTLAQKGKGMELNTSGLDRCGAFLPAREYFVRFRELGGEIVTVGSDAHNSARVGQYTREAVELLQDIFGYACTFENRQPIFHMR